MRFLIVIILMVSACSSTVPRVEVQEVKVPVPCIIPIGVIDPLELPPLPQFPGEESVDADIDKWLTDLRAVLRKREALLRARVDALAGQIDTHNHQEPLCGNN